MQRFSAVTAVKSVSREVFRDMPKQKHIADKRRKKPRYKEDYREQN